MTAIAEEIRVIGIGNGDRGDDGIGALVAERLRASATRNVSVLIRRGDALALIEDWRGAESVILVDAAAPMTAPGVIHRIDVIAEAMPSEPPLASTHGFGISQAVGLAYTLGLLPRHLILYAIEGASFAPGAAVTSEVAGAVDPAARRILREIEALRRVQVGVEADA